MAGPVGQGPFFVSLPSVTETLLSLIRPGQVLRGIIQGDSHTLSVVVAGRRFLLGDAPQLRAGLTVDIRVVQTEQGSQVQLTPRATGPPVVATEDGAENPRIIPGDAPRPSALRTSFIEGLIEAVLKALQGPISKMEATALLPTAVPLTEGAVRSLLGLFTSRATLGRDLELLADLVNQAVARGVLSPKVGERLTGQFRRLLVASAERLLERLPQIEQVFKTSVEGHIARFIAAKGEGLIPATLRGHLLSALSELEQHEALIKFLETEGKLKDFRGAMDRVTDRVRGGHVQNLRSPDLPYLFYEVPVSHKGALRSLQIHIFGEGSKKRGEIDPDNNTVVFDLAMAHLGDMWIRLAVREGFCTCTFKVKGQAILDAIENSSNDLVEDLSETGYKGVKVSASLWDGNRLREVVRLVGGLSGLRLEA